MSKFRASRTLTFHQSGEELTGCNFLTKQAFECTSDLIAFLGEHSQWTDLETIEASLASSQANDTAALLQALCDMTALVEEGSSLAAAEEEFEQRWAWSIPSALMHFSVENADYMTPEQHDQLQIDKAAQGSLPILYQDNARYDQPIALPRSVANDSVLSLMAKRRTVREFTTKPISLRAVSECLYSGLGITGWTSNVAGKLPLKMTPSGGARNPYEAYVFARNVDGLEPGIYHYSALEHTLGKLAVEDLPALSSLAADQVWMDDAAAMIVIVANFERTMWKYSDSNAYRVVLIEAGHIGQNVMLAATENKLTACPTAALHHDAIRQWLDLGQIAVSPVYALALGHPDQSEPTTGLQ